MFEKLAQKVAPIATKAVLKSKKHMPTIMTIGGVACIAGSLYFMNKGTVKATEIAKKKQEELDFAAHLLEHPEDADGETYTKETYDNDVQIIQRDKTVETVKAYAPSIMAAAAGITLVILSHGMLTKEVSKLASSLAVTSASFASYRNNAIERYGEEADKELALGVKAKETEKSTLTKSGKTKTETVVEKSVNPDHAIDAAGPYAFVYDSTCGSWVDDPNANEKYIAMFAADCEKKQRRVSKSFCTLNEFQQHVTQKTSNKGLIGDLYGWPMGVDIEWEVVPLSQYLNENDGKKSYCTDYVVIPKGLVNLAEHFNV